MARLEPEPGAVLPGFDGSVRIRFREPIANPRELERQVSTSPAWRWRFEPGRSGLELRPADGWRDGVVWFVRIPAGVRDLLGNATEEPVELLFSTGPPVTRTRAGGRLVDRVTGRPVQGGRVLFLAADTIPYTAVSDTGGRFSLRGLPPGSYLAIGFLDLNGNLRPDRMLEPHDSARIELDGPDAVATADLALTEPDSTPPVLTAAAVVDSLRLRLEFDDHLEPIAPEAARVTVRDSASGREWSVARFAVGELPGPAPSDTAAEGTPGEEPEARDGEPPDLEVQAEPVEEEGRTPVEPAAAAGEDAAQGEPLPSQRVTVELAEPLAAGGYRVTAIGFLNLRGLEGGGEAGLSWAGAPTPAEEGAPADDGEEAGEPAPGDAGAGEAEADEELPP